VAIVVLAQLIDEATPRSASSRAYNSSTLVPDQEELVVPQFRRDIRRPVQPSSAAAFVSRTFRRDDGLVPPEVFRPVECSIGALEQLRRCLCLPRPPPDCRTDWMAAMASFTQSGGTPSFSSCRPFMATILRPFSLRGWRSGLGLRFIYCRGTHAGDDQWPTRMSPRTRAGRSAGRGPTLPACPSCSKSCRRARFGHGSQRRSRRQTLRRATLPRQAVYSTMIAIQEQPPWQPVCAGYAN